MLLLYFMTKGSEATKQYVFCGRLLPSPGYADGQEQTSSSPPKFAGTSLSKRSRSPAENSSGRLTGSSLGPDDWRGYVFATSKGTCFGLLLYIVFIFIFLICVKCGLCKEDKISSYFFGKSISCTISWPGHWRISEVSLIYTEPYNFNYEILTKQKVVLQYVLLDRFMFPGRKLFPLVAS